MESVAITTKDNPYNPFNNFSEWFHYDITNGYNSSQYLARIANTSDTMTEEEYNTEINRAIDEIIDHDYADIYRKITDTGVITPNDN